MTYRITFLLALFICWQPAAAEPKIVRLLTVGNSFSANATEYLASIAKANGDTLILGRADIGGSSFEVHWKKLLEHEKDPKAKAGLYSSGRGLPDWLRHDKWDFISIQQASRKSFDVATYQPCARQMADYIRKHAPNARLLLHQTWAYRVDDPWFTTTKPRPNEARSQEEMYRGLKSAYAAIARELGTALIPVGDAFYVADHDEKWGYKVAPFDRKTAQPGQLPDQTHSLHVGFTWKGDSLAMDGHHASVAGKYLGACVWYEVLFGRSAEGNSYLPKGLDAEYARFLQTIAHQAVSQNEL
jgi:Domain of unknown function (DUF4886)